MTSRRTRLIAAFVLVLMSVASTPVLAAEAPAGQMTWALHFSLAPTLFEPAETAGLITPFMILYALHDALVKPMPEKTMAPSLAELIHDKAMVLPIWQLARLQGVGPRVAESGFGLIADYPWSAPYEELKLKAK